MKAQRQTGRVIGRTFTAVVCATRRAARSVALVLCAIGLAAVGTAEAQITEELRVTLSEDSRLLTLEMGPFDLPAGADHHAVAQPRPFMGPVPVDGYLHGYRVEIVDAQGRPVPQGVLHHINIITPDRRELFSNIMLRIGAAGQETGPVELPRFLGYRVKAGERIMLAGMLHNPTNESYEGVRVRVHMPFTPAGGFFRPLSVYPVYVDVMPPASIHEYDLPPGRSEKSWEGSPAVPGRLLGVGGHLHKYAVALRFEDVTTGKVIWEAAPYVDENGEVTGMPTKRFLWTFGVPLRPDHTYRLTAIYDNPTGETIPGGGMGTLGGIFRPSSGVEWPEVNREHPEYVLDVQITDRTLPGHPHPAGSHHDHGAAGQEGEHDDAHAAHGADHAAHGAPAEAAAAPAATADDAAHHHH